MNLTDSIDMSPEEEIKEEPVSEQVRPTESSFGGHTDKEALRSVVKEAMVSVFEDARIEKEKKRVRRDKALFKDSVHEGVTCDKCNMSPIVGIWYKSATKQNFDVCIDCEAQFGAEDVYLKIKRPEDFQKYIRDRE